LKTFFNINFLLLPQKEKGRLHYIETSSCFLISITVRVLIASNMRMHQHLWGAIFATQSFDVVDDLSADIIFYIEEIRFC